MKTFQYKGIGISDDAFIRGGVPMTKSEVRAVTLSKLKPQSEDVVLDIGAGTGAVSIECAFLADHVIAVECDADAAALIEANCERFKRNNIRLIIGKAPEALEQIKKVNCVFIGGSKGRLEDILYRVNALLADGGRIAANFIIPENAVLFHKRLQAGAYCDIEMVQVQVNKGRPVGETIMMQAQNPVMIASGVRKR